MEETWTAPRSRRARAVVHYIRNAADHPYARLLDVRREGDRDLIDVDVEVELAQDRRVAILPHEPVRLVFACADDTQAPRVLSLRGDFPLGQVHTNLDRDVDGLCLCIWEENWNDLSSNLTGQMLIERVRNWLSGMAHGVLHADEQALEPLIAPTSDTLVVPPGLLAGPWHVQGATNASGRWTLLMARESPADDAKHPYSIFYRLLPSQVHRALASRPYELGGLRDLVAGFGFDLIRELRDWLLAPEQLAEATMRRVLLILAIPKRRTPESDDETPEIWAYTIGETLAALGEKLGITFTFQENGTSITARALGSTSEVDLAGIPLPQWRVVQRLDRAAARKFAGSGRAADAKLVAIGAGAIGSNVVINTTKAGLGTWTIIDDDVTLPHNTVRQFQMNRGVGYSKATVLRIEADCVLAEEGNEDIVANVLRPGNAADRIAGTMRGADLVVDFSASPSVVGHLADLDIARAASFFFSPDGADLALLAEGTGRGVLLDEIEAQYFLAVAAHPALDGHLAAARTDRIRYANACQDLSRPLPPWQVQMLGGLAGGQLPDLLGRTEPSAAIWRLDPSTGEVRPVRLKIQPTHRIVTDKLRVSVSDAVVRTMREFRRKAAPDETGGILIGTYDLVRNRMHIVAALPAPLDSRQAPTYFVRGARDLRPMVDDLARVTAGRLRYVGEWHSHPDGAAARPSADDEQVFEHLRSHLEPVESPFAMMICGRTETWARAGWQDRGQVEGIVAHEGG